MIVSVAKLPEVSGIPKTGQYTQQMLNFSSKCLQKASNDNPFDKQRKSTRMWRIYEKKNFNQTA